MPGWRTASTDPPLHLAERFLSADQADELLALCERHIPWESPSITIYGREHVIPRSQCWMGSPGSRYRYSGRTLEPHPWHPALKSLRQRIIQALQTHGLPWTDFNSVLLNRYDGGNQRMGWHSDDEPELGPDPIVAAISLGSERPLRFRPKSRRSSAIDADTPRHGREAFNLWLPHGSLLLMGPGTQHHWQHALAPRAIPGVRLNLTFRRVVSPP